MAKNKELEVNVAATKWDGTAFSFIGTLLLAILAFAFMVAIPVVVGAVLGVFNEGGDKLMLLVVLIALVVFAIIGLDCAIVIFMKWSVRHTIINGQRMKLKASAFGLFLNGFKWLFFTVITVGIYLFWIPVAIARWKADHIVPVAAKEEAEEDEEEEVVENQPQIVYYTVEDDE